MPLKFTAWAQIAALPDSREKEIIALRNQGLWPQYPFIGLVKPENKMKYQAVYDCDWLLYEDANLFKPEFLVKRDKGQRMTPEQVYDAGWRID